jgi:hypothetical protein
MDGTREWHGFWKTLGGYAGRRLHVERLAARVLDELRARRDADRAGRLGRGDGPWARGDAQPVASRGDDQSRSAPVSVLSIWTTVAVVPG